MTKIEFMEGIHILQDNYNRKLTASQLKIYYENLKDMDKDRYILNIKQHIKTNSLMPTIAEVRKELVGNNFQNANLNSSYWYINLQQWCDINKQPYYDITTGEPLPQYKEG